MAKVVTTGLSQPDLAFSMWRDLLLEYSDYLTDGKYISILIDNILKSFCRTDYPRENGIFERVIPCFNKYPEIVEVIYGKAGMACYCGNPTCSLLCLACCIVSNQAEMTYTIVPESESDLKSGKISVSSPIAKALIGNSKGDVVTVQAPAGTMDFQILDVSR